MSKQQQGPFSKVSIVEVDEDGNSTRIYEVTDGAETFYLDDYNFNTVSFRSNLVMRWEFRPGSTLFVVWQRNLSDYANLGDPVNVGDMFSSLGAAGWYTGCAAVVALTGLV